LVTLPADAGAATDDPEANAAPLGPSPLVSGDELSVSAAWETIRASLSPIEATEEVALADAVGRVLAQALVSPLDVPAHDNSAMDGYALRGTELATAGPTRLQALPLTVFAGQPLGGPVAAGHCVRIMTGAVMPAGLDTVVPLELCSVQEGWVSIEAGVIRSGDNRRHRGEDLRCGQPALAARRRLRPADLGLAASLGVSRLKVFRRLRVALFSTGDELRAPGEALAPGCLYDSNRYTLLGALARLGVEVLDLGLVPDNEAALQAALDMAVQSCDAVITSGGVSMGDADNTRQMLQRLGQVAFWKVAMRPGRPFAFGALQRRASAPAAQAQAQSPAGALPSEVPHLATSSSPAVLFALPGNPVAALVSFYAFAQPALHLLAGASEAPLPGLQARATAAIRKRPGRTEFQRAIVSRTASGVCEVKLTGSQGAGILRSMSEANALVVLGHDQGPVAAGDWVEVWPFDGLV